MNEIVYKNKVTYGQLMTGCCFIHNHRMFMKLDRRDTNAMYISANLANGQTIVLPTKEEITPVTIKVYEV